MLTGASVAATVVALMQYLRTRERRVLPLLALFTCLTLAHSREWWSPWKERWQWAALAAGLAALAMLHPRSAHTAHSSDPQPPAPPEEKPS